MVILHAIWTKSELHLWGERRGHAEIEAAGVAAAGAFAVGEPDRFALSAQELRRRLGDVFDSLLISQARDSNLVLRLPHANGRLLHSSHALAAPNESAEDAGLTLAPHSVTTLTFEPSDVLDLLCGEVRLPTCYGAGQEASDGMYTAASIEYWRRAAGLVRELLARQQFVPAVHRSSDGACHGYWRAIVSDAEVARRIGLLIAAMPPVCRAFDTDAGRAHPAALVESFLWKAVDGLVRRCVASDELTHGICDRDGDNPLKMRWLRSLVAPDSRIAGTPEECAEIYDRVQSWTANLEPQRAARLFTTSFRIQSPEVDPDDGVPYWQRPWSLSIHLQSVNEPNLILPAEQVLSPRSGELRILGEPAEQARQQLRADLQQASRQFQPLGKLLEAGLPSQCELSLDEAYSFLRDAAPVLCSEGFGVQTPRWWRDSGSRLGLRLDVRPVDESAGLSAGAKMGLDALVEYNWRAALGDEDISDEELARLAERQQPLLRLRGQWFEVQPTDIQTAIRFLERGRSGRSTVFEALRQIYLSDDQRTGLPVTSLRSHGWLSRLLDGDDGAQRLDMLPQPPTFHGTLRPYQLKGASWFAFLSRLGIGSCLADDMGLGKTIQLIALLLAEREGGASPGPTLLIVPTSLVGNWHRELARFGPSLRAVVHHGLERRTGEAFVDQAGASDVVISTYALTYRDFEHLSAVQWHRVALDEAQNIKNPAAKQTVATHSLRAVHRVAMTGTPVENRLSELWSIMDFLNPGFLGPAAEFRRRFAIPVERYGDAAAARRLRQLIRPFVLRRVKDDPNIEVDLPEKMEMKVYCNLTQEQAGLYEAVLGEMLGQIDGAGGIRRRGLILATLVKLKQICNHPAQFLSNGSVLSRRSGKSDRLVEMLEEVIAEGDRALVFSQFREMGKLLERQLKETLGIDALFLHGGTPARQRDEMIQRFQGRQLDTPVFILSLRAGGFGLNLTAANHVFHFDRWWNPAVEDQATDRVHRLGQTRRVQVRKFVCIGTLEERIDALLENKRQLADTIVGSGEDWLTELSTQQLRDLFTLSRDAVMVS
jgi:SNF2 family DNA or RNA helicase